MLMVIPQSNNLDILDLVMIRNASLIIVTANILNRTKYMYLQIKISHLICSYNYYGGRRLVFYFEEGGGLFFFRFG